MVAPPWHPVPGPRQRSSLGFDGETIVGDVPVNGHLTAAKWLGGTGWRSLGGYPGSHGCPDLSDAFAVSNAGSVVGLGWDDCDATGFRWDPSTGMVSLGKTKESVEHLEKYLSMNPTNAPNVASAKALLPSLKASLK